MTYFEDQEEAWFANDCKGRIEDYDPFDPGNFVEEKPRKHTAGGGRDRALLALSRLEEFASWAAAQGYRREAVKGTYEILRLRTQGQKPVLFYRKDRTAGGGEPVHATCQSDGSRLVHRWLSNRKQVKP